MLRTTLATLAILALTAGASVARPGDDHHPIPLNMALQTDTITVRGVLSQRHECCTYSFKAQAGQTLHWTETGAVARMGIQYPDGDGINPGLPSPTPLPQTGTYLLMVQPDLMADGAFGPFKLTVRIPPP
jgi:hypothetical protein